jgi:hypothetical protein
MPTLPSDSTSIRQTVFHLLLLALLGLGLGCKSPLSDNPPAPQGAETVTAFFSLGASDLASSQGSGTSARVAHVSTLGFSFQDVTRVRIDVLVHEAAGGTSPLFRDVDLSRGSDGLWTGRLPFLPKMMMEPAARPAAPSPRPRAALPWKAPPPPSSSTTLLSLSPSPPTSPTPSASPIGTATPSAPPSASAFVPPPPRVCVTPPSSSASTPSSTL